MGLQATPLFLSKNCPVVEWLSHSPPGPGVACSLRLRRHRSLREGNEPAPGRVEAATGDVSGRRMVLDADEDIEPPLTEAALDLVGQLPDVGEPEGLPRAAGGLVRPRDSGGDHNGAPLRQERTGAGVRGRRPLARPQRLTLGRLA